VKNRLHQLDVAQLNLSVNNK